MFKKSRNFIILVAIMLVTILPIQNVYGQYTAIRIEAHSGRTDSSGGHKDNKNKSGLGSYHYHCGGYPAHLHKDGKCPYSSSSTTSSKKTSDSTSSKKSTSEKSSSKQTDTDSKLIKKVQKALNDLGYDCGKADGVLGSNTKKAIKAFQKDNNLTVDGKIGKQVKKALNIK